MARESITRSEYTAQREGHEVTESVPRSGYAMKVWVYEELPCLAERAPNRREVADALTFAHQPCG
jgi:hypothetical protein